MQKFLSIVAVVAMASAAFGQGILSEDFESWGVAETGTKVGYWDAVNGVETNLESFTGVDISGEASYQYEWLNGEPGQKLFDQDNDGSLANDTLEVRQGFARSDWGGSNAPVYKYGAMGMYRGSTGDGGRWRLAATVPSAMAGGYYAAAYEAVVIAAYASSAAGSGDMTLRTRLELNGTQVGGTQDTRFINANTSKYYWDGTTLYNNKGLDGVWGTADDVAADASLQADAQAGRVIVPSEDDGVHFVTEAAMDHTNTAKSLVTAIPAGLAAGDEFRLKVEMVNNYGNNSKRIGLGLEAAKLFRVIGGDTNADGIMTVGEAVNAFANIGNAATDYTNGDDDADADVEVGEAVKAFANISAAGYAAQTAPDGEPTATFNIDAAGSVLVDGGPINLVNFHSDAGLLSVQTNVEFFMATSIFPTVYISTANDFAVGVDGSDPFADGFDFGVTYSGDQTSDDLSVTYSTAATVGLLNGNVVPEPATLAMLAIGGLAAVIRRRK